MDVMAETVKLTLGLTVTPRTRALFDRTVRPEGIELRCESEFGEGLDNTGRATGLSSAAPSTAANVRLPL
jgi:hypothetical protein